MVEKRHFNEEGNDSFGRSKRRQEFQMRAFRHVISERELENFFEPVVRRVVREEVDRALLPLHPCPRHSLPQGACSGVRSLHLHFVNRLPSTTYTNKNIEADDGTPIRIELIDTRSRTIVKSGPLSSIKLDIVVLDGDFCFDDQEDWTEQDFNASILREREGKRPLVVGDLKVTLIEGAGCIGDIQFTDNSSWVRSRKFILGAKVEQKLSSEVRIREARSKHFMVKDHRGELIKKHKTPSLDDEIWRLKKIAKDGAYHKRLSSAGIQTVNDLLLKYAISPSSVRNTFARVSDGKWEEIIEHAMTCVENDPTLYTYRAGESVGLRFNSIYQVIEATFDGHNYCPVHTLGSDEKRAVEVLKQQAYKNMNDWVLVDELSTLSFSRPSESLPDEAFSVPEQGLQQFDFPVTHQDQQETWLGFNHSHSSCSAPHIHTAETSNKSEASKAQNSHLMPSNGLMEDVFTGLYNGQVSILPSGYITVHDIPQVQIPTCIPGTPWEQGNDFFFAQSNQADFGYFPLSNSGVPILRTGKPKVAWCKIRAAVKWGTVRRDVAKRMARPIYNY